MFKRLLRIILTLTTRGCALTLFLVLARYLHLLVPCPVIGACKLIFTSQYSNIYGVPWSVLGFIIYFILLTGTLTTVLKPASSRRILTACLYLSLTAAIVSTSLTIFAVAFLKARCIWCIASNVIFLLLTSCYALTLTAKFSNDVHVRTKSDVWFSVVLVLLFALAEIGGVMKTWSIGEVTYYDGKVFSQLSESQLLTPDSPSFRVSKAELVFVLFIDFDDPKSFVLSSKTTELAQFNSNVGVVLRHYPRSEGSWLRSVDVALGGPDYAREYLLRESASVEVEASENEDSKRAVTFRFLNSATRAELGDAFRSVLIDYQLARSLRLSSSPAWILVKPGKSSRVVQPWEMREILAGHGRLKVGSSARG